MVTRPEAPPPRVVPVNPQAYFRIKVDHEWDIGRYVTTCVKCGCDPMDPQADKSCPGQRPQAQSERPEWLPDDVATHWPNGDPVGVRDVLDAALIPDVPTAFWLHPLPTRPFGNRQNFSGRAYVPPRVKEEAPALRRHRDQEAYIAKHLHVTGSITSAEYERRLKKIYGDSQEGN